jgi:hypothetical protein
MTFIFHPVRDRIIKVRDLSLKSDSTFDEDGELFDQKYVEFTVIGNRTEYQDFMLLDDFKTHNPKVVIEE